MALSLFPSEFAMEFHFFSDVAAFSAVVYAYLFIVIFGILILHIYEKYLVTLENIYLRPIKGPDPISLMAFEKFKAEIFLLRQVMNTYSEIAGIYFLAVLYYTAVNWFRFLNYITNDNKVSFLVDSMSLNIFSVTALGYIACFGNYLSNRDQQKHVSRLIRANELLKLSYLQNNEECEKKEDWRHISQDLETKLKVQKIIPEREKLQNRIEF
ncbi:unnamed protein product [Allacma fusca]|uniref:Uncharacterized protein n=1 Tax=Allacma fusca TaxID=39272 RepID=A0A8J2LCA1_9HEXA|nr:unnamed protein product [Allacma fusca]